MNMPRVECPTTEWILKNDPLKSYQKKGCPRAGVSLSTTQKRLSIIQKVAQMTGITLLSYGCPAFKYIFVSECIYVGDPRLP